MDTTIAAPVQHLRTELALHDDTELPPGFDRLKYPILARHVFGLVPKRPAIRLVSSQPSTLPDAIVDEAIERLSWNAYIAAIDAHDHHQTASTQRSLTAALVAWQHVFLLDERKEVWS